MSCTEDVRVKMLENGECEGERKKGGIGRPSTKQRH